MAKQKNKKISNVISVRVSDHEMESIRELMRLTKLNASAVLREAFRSILPPAA